MQYVRRYVAPLFHFIQKSFFIHLRKPDYLCGNTIFRSWVNKRSQYIRLA